VIRFVDEFRDAGTAHAIAREAELAALRGPSQKPSRSML
jgi:hypothetical protein